MADDKKLNQEIAKLASIVYQDGLKEAVAETGKILARIPKTIRPESLIL